MSDGIRDSILTVVTMLGLFALSSFLAEYNFNFALIVFIIGVGIFLVFVFLGIFTGRGIMDILTWRKQQNSKSVKEGMN